ncbi:outer membrane protein [Jiella avicenniae]|uniref:Outer membrane beta-barrel protein n=1 Tax=Jiella avicenniae TaxID=2907202 RepID=A0A9X1P5J9_9HYPH|nr:outer membrane beta-barrel protein [Jiella avicenniae]MCE7029703.1 outer membrane beta-barrel protein [Jiella avicenniae]
MKRLALLLATAALSTPAMAADVLVPEPPAPAPMAIEPVAQTTTWTGLNLGVQAGAAFGGHAGDANFDPGTATALGGGDSNFEHDGNFVGGANIGYDYQFQNNVVLGAVADFNYIDREKKTSYATPGGTSFEDETKLNYLGTVRARLGYAMDNVLFYGTGGLAYGDVEQESSAPSTSAGSQFAGYSFDSSHDKSSVGYTAGAGVDVMATQNLSFGVEYLYTNLGKNSSTITGTDGLGNTVEYKSNDDQDFDFHTVWAKASYHFN